MVAQPVRVQIIDAAARCFAKRGSDNTSIDDIARYLGITPVALSRTKNRR